MPSAYLSDVFRRLPTQPGQDIKVLLPYSWRPATDSTQD